MKLTVEFTKDGLIKVTSGKRAHLVTEANFRFDGGVPFMDLSHPLGELGGTPSEQDESTSRYMDGSPKPA